MSKVKFNIGGVIVEMEQEEVSKAIETGEVKIESDNLVVYSKPDFETFVTNKADLEYKKGRIDGVDILGKQLKKDGGFEFENPKVFLNATGNVDFEKTSSELIGKLKPAFESVLKIEPTKKIQELERDLEKVQKNYIDLEDQFNGYKTQITEKETRNKKDNTLLSFIPSTGLKVDRDITLMALKNKACIDIGFGENNEMFVTENGQPVKDSKLLSYIEPKQYILDKLTALELIDKPSGGKGEGDDGKGGQASNYDKFVKEMEANGIDEGSQKFSEEMNIRIKAGTLKI